jgi:hypothetical protein
MDKIDPEGKQTPPPGPPVPPRPGGHQYFSSGPYPPPNQQPYNAYYGAAPGYGPPPGGQYGPPPNQWGPPPPHGYHYPPWQPPPPPALPERRPHDAPPVPTGSRPLVPGGGGATGPSAADDAPPPYSPREEDEEAAYWTADFGPDVPVGKNFDFDLGAGGWGNDELQTYTSFAPNAFHAPGRALTLRAIVRSAAPAARDRHTSARLVSKERLGRRRGYVGASLAAPCAAGVWPAFWLLPEEPFSWPADGEVDVFEAWNGAGVNHACLHWGGYTGTPEDRRKHRIVTTPIERITQPHAYGFAWEQPEMGGEGGRMVWYVDGVPVMKASKPDGTRRFEGWRVLLNVALGGNVCDGRVPADGAYDLVVERLEMCEAPPGGWQKFDMDWHKAPEGRTL